MDKRDKIILAKRLLNIDEEILKINKMNTQISKILQSIVEELITTK